MPAKGIKNRPIGQHSRQTTIQTPTQQPVNIFSLPYPVTWKVFSRMLACSIFFIPLLVAVENREITVCHPLKTKRTEHKHNNIIIQRYLSENNGL